MNELMLPTLLSSQPGDGIDTNFANVVLLMRGEGATGAQNSYFYEDSVYRQPVTAFGDVTQGNFSPYSKEPGRWGAKFGTTSNITWPSNITVAAGSNSFSCEAWIYLIGNAGQTYGIIFAGSNIFGAGGDTGNLQFQIGNDGSIGMVMEGFNAVAASAAAGTFKFNQWNHVVWCRSASTTAIFYNGTRVASGSSTYAGTFRYINGYSSYQCQGYISNARILTGSSAYNAASSTITVPTSPLTAITDTKLLTCQDNRTKDNSASPYTLTPTSVQITPSSPYANPVPYSTNRDGASVYFDGSGDYLTIPYNANLVPGTGDFTLEMWFYTTKTALLDKQTLFSMHTSTDGITVSLNVSNIGDIAVLKGNTEVLKPVTGLKWGSGWNHLAVSRLGTDLRIYIGGFTVAQQANDTTNFTGSTSLYIGAKGDGTQAFTGFISNVRFIKGTAIYSGFEYTVPTGPVAAVTNTQLLTCQDVFLKDYSTNNYTISKTGNADISTFNPFTASYPVKTSTDIGGMYFDGTGDYLNLTQDSTIYDINASYTFESWFYPTATTDQVVFNRGGGNTVVGNQWNATDGHYYLLCYVGGLAYWQWNQNNAGAPASLSGAIRANEWNHLAAGFNGTTTRFWINGVSAGTSTTAYTIPTNRSITTVGRSASNEAFAKGFITDVRLVKGTDVYGVGNTTITVPTSPLRNITNTRILLSGTNAGIVDSARTNVLYTRGDAKLSTTQKKYGLSSIAFDGTGDYIFPVTDPYIDQLQFGNGNFTIEFWVYFNNVTGQQIIYDGRPASTNGAYPTIYTSGTNLLYFVSSADRITATSALAATTWYHIAVCRSGTSTRMFRDGTQVGSTYTDSTVYLGVASRPLIGIAGTDGVSAPLNGYIDELRVTRGVARYTANFTRPNDRFPGA